MSAAGAGVRAALGGLPAVALGLALLSASGCTEAKTYAYFVVKMNVDPVTIEKAALARVTSCVLLVQGSDMALTDAHCMPRMTSYDLGAADFSTDARSGQIRFVLQLNDFNNVKIGEGKSDFVGILPNKTVTTSVLAKLVSDTGTLDGGADTAPVTGADGAADVLPSPTDGGDTSAPADAGDV